MYSVKIRKSIMIAHSLPHPFFGPAQNLHGATYVVEIFKGHLTTTEFVARHIHDQIKEEVSGFFNGRISIELGETHDAWASYEG